MAIDSLSPSFQRTLCIASSGFGATSGLWQPAKDPAITLDYWLDASLLVSGALPPDTVASVTATVVSANATPPTVTESGTDGTFVMVNVAGGADGDNPTIELLLTFTSGRTYAYAGILPIRAVAPTTP